MVAKHGDCLSNLVDDIDDATAAAGTHLHWPDDKEEHQVQDDEYPTTSEVCLVRKVGRSPDYLEGAIIIISYPLRHKRGNLVSDIHLGTSHRVPHLVEGEHVMTMLKKGGHEGEGGGECIYE